MAESEYSTLANWARARSGGMNTRTHSESLKSSMSWDFENRSSFFSNGPTLMSNSKKNRSLTTDCVYFYEIRIWSHIVVGRLYCTRFWTGLYATSDTQRFQTLIMSAIELVDYTNFWIQVFTSLHKSLQTFANAMGVRIYGCQGIWSYDKADSQRRSTGCGPFINCSASTVGCLFIPIR